MTQTGQSTGPGEWFVEGAAAAAELNFAVGWSVEWSRDNIQFGGRGNHVRVQDDDGYIAILSYASGVEIYDGSNQYYPIGDTSFFGSAGFVLDAGFHTFRLERGPGSATALFTIDGGVNGSVEVDATLTSVLFDLGGPAVRWGADANGALADVVWDYFNIEAGAPGLPGDVNFDGLVNIFDINLVSANWGTPGGPTGDANSDGNVDIFDINLISANWTPAGGAAAVPEPSAAILAGLGLLGLLCAVRARGKRAMCSARV